MFFAHLAIQRLGRISKQAWVSWVQVPSQKAAQKSSQASCLPRIHVLGLFALIEIKIRKDTLDAELRSGVFAGGLLSRVFTSPELTTEPCRMPASCSSTSVTKL